MTDYKLVPKSIVDELAQFIRQVDGNNRMGAGSLADKICERFRVDAPAVQGEPVAYISHTSEGDILGWERQFDAPSHTPLYAAPQPAEREIPGSYPVSGQIFFREPSNEWVLELSGSVNGTRFTARHTQPADTRPEDVAGLPALYEPVPDVEALVEALEQAGLALHEMDDGHAALVDIDNALAAHRRQGDEA